MRFINRKALALAGAAAALVAVGSTGTAVADNLIGSAGIANESIRSADIKNGDVRLADLSAYVSGKLAQAGTPGPRGAQGETGPVGPQGEPGTPGAAGATGADGKDGKDGKDGVAGLYYVTAKYGTDSDNVPSVSVNEGAIATVACNSVADTAVAGGVQTLGLGGHPAAVASSFPGRMDWDTNKPKVDRLDGWIVQFDARQAPVKADIWVLCATDTKVPQTVKTIS
jgi:hypothetical protein